MYVCRINSKIDLSRFLTPRFTPFLFNRFLSGSKCFKVMLALGGEDFTGRVLHRGA